MIKYIIKYPYSDNKATIHQVKIRKLNQFETLNNINYCSLKSKEWIGQIVEPTHLSKSTWCWWAVFDYFQDAVNQIEKDLQDSLKIEYTSISLINGSITYVTNNSKFNLPNHQF